MSLNDVLCCPVDHQALTAGRDRLTCRGCGRSFPVRSGAPVFILDTELEVENERDTVVREGYENSEKFILDSLRPDQVILDMGSGNRSVENDRIIRMDVVLTTLVDVVADAHALPFRTESLDLVYSTATFEHLHHPFRAAAEIHRVLKPGGYVLVDCNFVFPFHGFPAVYFNASQEGMRHLFEGFTELEAVVAPWQGPGYALRAIHAEYLRLFRPRSETEETFARALRALGEFPLESFDDGFTQDEAARLAAATTFLGVKQPAGEETTLAPPVLAAWHADPALQARYPRPTSLIDMVTPAWDNLFRWAEEEGRKENPAIAAWYEALVPFSKALHL